MKTWILIDFWCLTPLSAISWRNILRTETSVLFLYIQTILAGNYFRSKYQTPTIIEIFSCILATDDFKEEETTKKKGITKQEGIKKTGPPTMYFNEGIMSRLVKMSITRNRHISVIDYI